MAFRNLDYWYDGQQRRFLEQLVRAFSGFQYLPGVRNGVQQPLATVPCMYAQTNRMVGHILRNLSSNTLLTVPMMTVFQTGLSGRRDDVQYPGFVEKIQAIERAVQDGQYTGERGQGYTVERIMPRPFEMRCQLDIWTSNLDQKYQLLEQILTVIYPAFDIQNSVNALDWTSLTTVYVENINLTSRAIPIGTESEIDITTVELRLPIWLSPPVKVKRQQIITTIIANIFDSPEQDGVELQGPYMTDNITSPHNHRVLVEGNVITLMNAKGGEYDAQGQLCDWSTLIREYGTFQPGISQIRLYTDNRLRSPTQDIPVEDFDPTTGAYVGGTFTLDPNAVNQIIFQIDPSTLPANTMDAVNALIEPLRSYPGNDLPAAAEGQRYLILQDIGPSVMWPDLTAYANDVIQFVNGAWRVVFSARDNPAEQYIVNAYSNRQLRWTGQEWVVAIDGDYGPGYWRLLVHLRQSKLDLEVIDR